MKQKGLTLVELLVVMAVLAVVGIFILNIFTSTLRGTNKTQVLGVIKQNGQAVLETMDKTIRNSDNVVCPFFLSPTDNTVSSSTLVTVKDGIYTRYRFIPPNNLSPAIGNCGTTGLEVNGCFMQDNPEKRDIGPSPSRQETEPEFVNRICNVGSSMLSNAVFLTDTNTQTGVSVENGLFIRDRSSGFKDQVTIKFNLKPGEDAPASIRGQIDPVTFQTTINLR